MEQLYSETPDRCKLITASPETVRFLLDYSRSLHVVKTGGATFENNLN